MAALNDRLRQTLEGGRVLTTPGIKALSQDKIFKIFTAVQNFNTFTRDNDPYGEHDFGAVEVEGTKCFWKIDYYDQSLEMHSPDKFDPEVTVRVLTVMLAEEY